MNDELSIHRIANLLADPARATILWALIDGQYRALDAETHRDIKSGKLRL